MPTLKLRQDAVRGLRYQGPGGKHQCVYWDEALESFGVRVYPASRGIDVQARREVAKAEAVRRRASTLAVFIEDYYEPWARNHLRTCKFQVKRIKTDFKSWLDRPMGGDR